MNALKISRLIRLVDVCLAVWFAFWGGALVLMFLYWTILPQTVPALLRPQDLLAMLTEGILLMYAALFLNRREYLLALVNACIVLAVLLLYAKPTPAVIIFGALPVVYLYAVLLISKHTPNP